MFLQSYVIPICQFELSKSEARIKKTIGTAFFINDTGFFMTAKHVIKDAIDNLKGDGGFIGLIVKGNEGKSPDNFAVPIISYSLAENPYDIAVGITNYKCETPLRIKDAEAGLWREVITLGYPVTALVQKPNDFRVNIRGHKGYIQRLISLDDQAMSLEGQEHPNSFELNFTIGYGLSGSPLIVYNAQEQIVVGVCVGSKKTEYRDSIEEYGIAQDIRPLLDWKPDCFFGKSLKEVSNLYFDKP
ncbi:hypothetical protein Lnau_2127 [Legionella nautarum]|uniref:Trypsin-like peptidase domain-containing protein n=1 Tax=Legionella nautarum TaxID=45070 RepID=A0A0W0WNF4_9GAMM|nr:serine protease [Legionella nautarum]KTD33835.1 hypothetical protein Lnau_2127 [Legionella nautarum]